MQQAAGRSLCASSHQIFYDWVNAKCITGYRFHPFFFLFLWLNTCSCLDDFYVVRRLSHQQRPLLRMGRKGQWGHLILDHPSCSLSALSLIIDQGPLRALAEEVWSATRLPSSHTMWHRVHDTCNQDTWKGPNACLSCNGMKNSRRRMKRWRRQEMFPGDQSGTVVDGEPRPAVARDLSCSTWEAYIFWWFHCIYCIHWHCTIPTSVNQTNRQLGCWHSTEHFVQQPQEVLIRIALQMRCLMRVALVIYCWYQEGGTEVGWRFNLYKSI